MRARQLGASLLVLPLAPSPHPSQGHMVGWGRGAEEVRGRCSGARRQLQQLPALLLREAGLFFLT